MNTNKTVQPEQTDLSRAVKTEKAAMPKRATLDLQRRPRPTTPRKLKAFLQIARGHKV